MRRRNSLTLVGIALLLAFTSWVMISNRINIPLIGEREGMVLGLDLRGGVNLEYQADFTGIAVGERAARLEETKRIIEKRINEFGVTEPAIQTMGEDRISIQLPGVTDVAAAKDLVGKTAELDFREPVLDANGEPVLDEDGRPQFGDIATGTIDGVERPLTGAYLLPNCYVDINPQTGEPLVAFEWDDEGAELFSQITGRLIGKPLGIFLDNELVSGPLVQSQIWQRGVIEGLSLDEAQRLTIQLNTGALPVPLHIVREQTVSAILGADSLQKSLMAGMIGLGLVLLFMIVYYRLPGILASVALIIYATIVLSIFKLVPVTLTLAGIAALILSLGMAVDANILIFERTKEEIRSGKSLKAAIEAGFDRAWPAIRDGNVSTFITCAILYWFGSKFGAAPVMGFALTLFIGVAVSMFTAIVVTRTFLRSITLTPLARRIALFRP